MCRQVKMGFTDCPHVALDLTYLYCKRYKSNYPCRFDKEGIPDIVWEETKEVGKCHFCMLEEADARKTAKEMKHRLRKSTLHDGFEFLKEEKRYIESIGERVVL
jgi:hypothetical protein